MEDPFLPSEVLQVPVGLYGKYEVQAPLDASKQFLVGVKLLAPSEVG